MPLCTSFFTHPLSRRMLSSGMEVPYGRYLYQLSRRRLCISNAIQSFVVLVLVGEFLPVQVCT